MVLMEVPNTYNALPHQCFTIQWSHTKRKAFYIGAIQWSHYIYNTMLYHTNALQFNGHTNTYAYNTNITV
jgi:hypothetical protein